MKHLFAKIFGIATLSMITLAQAEAAPPGLGNALPGLLDWAETHSSQINAMRFSAEASQQQITRAGALDDPMFKIEWMGIDKNKPTLTPNRVGEMQYTLSQALPLWGKRDLKTQAAEANAAAAQQEVIGTRAQLRAEIRQGYAQWYRALTSLRINEEQSALLKQMELSASQRYAVGKAPQSEALRLQMEISLLANEALAYQNMAEQARAALAASLNLPAQDLTGQPRQLPTQPPPLAAAHWVDAAQTQNPDLAATRKQAEAAQAQLDLTRLNSRPGLNIGVSARQMGNQLRSYGLMLEFQIPLQQGAKNAEQSEAAAMLMKARADEQTRLRMIERDIYQMSAMTTTARNQVELLDKTLLPQAELTLQSSLASYTAGRGEFASLLEAQQQIRRLRLMRLGAEFDAFQANSNLQKMTGDQ